MRIVGNKSTAYHPSFSPLPPWNFNVAIQLLALFTKSGHRRYLHLGMGNHLMGFYNRPTNFPPLGVFYRTQKMFVQNSNLSVLLQDIFLGPVGP